MKKKINFYLFFCLLFLALCTSKKNEFEETVNLQNAWDFNSPASFKFKVTDKKHKTLSVLIRNNNDYEFSNIYFFVHHYNPNGKKSIDTLQYFLADKKGKWIGKGYSEIKQNLLELKSSKKYPIGTHKVEIFHGMRKKKLIGLEDITLILK